MSVLIWDFVPDTADVDPTTQFRTLVSAFEDGSEQRRKKWSTPKKSFALSYKTIDREQRKDMDDFFRARFGRFDNFYYEHDGDSPILNQEILGTGDGSTTLFQLDSFPVVPLSETIDLNGVPQTRVTDYAINDTTGAITFVSPPGGGVVVSTDVYRFFYIVRFSEDGFTPQSLYRSRAFSIKIGFVTDPGA